MRSFNSRRFPAAAPVRVLAAVVILTAMAVMAGIRPVVIVSGSMEPEIPTGSLCFVDTRDRDAA